MVTEATVCTATRLKKTRLFWERVTQGFTQKTLSKRTGIPQAQISIYEKGYEIPSEDLERLAYQLRIRPSEVLMEKVTAEPVEN